MYFHAAVLDIFRGLLGKKLRLGSFTAGNNTPEAAFRASLDQLKHLAFTYQTTFPEATSTYEWNHACFYIANAVVRDTSDEDWAKWFKVCLRCYVGLARSYGSASYYLRGILAMDVKIRKLSVKEAQKILVAAAKLVDRPQYAACLRITFDQEEALTNLSAAQMGAVLKEFEVTPI